MAEKIKYDLSDVEFIEYVTEQSKSEFPCFSLPDVKRFRDMAEEAGCSSVSPRQSHPNPSGQLVQVDHLRFLLYRDIQSALAAVEKFRFPKKEAA